MSETKLSIEQEFAIQSFKTRIREMNREQAIEMLGKIYEQMIIQEATYRVLIKSKWGIE